MGFVLTVYLVYLKLEANMNMGKVGHQLSRVNIVIYPGPRPLDLPTYNITNDSPLFDTST